MMKSLLLTTIGLLFFFSIQAQNVFSPTDPINRYNGSQPLGSTFNPDPSIPGLQKWVSVATNGVTGSFDASSYKSYFINYNGSQMAFRIKFPKSYSNPDSAGKKYPAMLFFHGAGESGCPSNGGLYNNEKQLLHGGQLFRDRVDNNLFDGFLFYPQNYNSFQCWGTWGTAPFSPYYQMMVNVLDSLAKYSRLDVDRVVVTGLSDGGVAAFSMTSNYPQRVAKAIPSAAATDQALTSQAFQFIHIPIWFATGGLDSNPTIGYARSTHDSLKTKGADVTWLLYPDAGHFVWNAHWLEPNFVAQMNDMHKANPLVFFQKNAYCPGDPISTKLGITRGYYEYEWQKDGVTIASALLTNVNTGTNPVTYTYSNTIHNGSSIISFTSNEITVNAFGTYRVRFKRLSTSNWSAWSPKPAVIQPKAATQTPPIQVTGIKSKVLPAPDGSTTVPLELPAGYLSYEWRRVVDNALLSTQRTFNASVGQYKAKVIEQGGCGAIFSPDFTVVDASGSPKPEAAKNLTATPSSTTIQLDWNQKPNPGQNETAFEIYRSTTAGGPYQLVYITAPDVITYTDQGLSQNTRYYYIVRAVGAFGAAANSNEATALTTIDTSPPTAPGNLEVTAMGSQYGFLKWLPSTDNIGIDKYDIYVNGVKMYTSSTTSYNVTNLDSNQSYTFTVKARDAAGNISAPSNQVNASTTFTLTGINYKHYFGSWSVLPDFNVLNPVETGFTPNIDLTVRNQNDNFGFLWHGYIKVPTTATYTFEICSDDGSKLYVAKPYDNATAPLINNDGLHGNNCVSGSIFLSKGVHPIAIPFFEAGGGETLTFNWQNNAGISKAAVPASVLFRSYTVTGTPPAAPTNLTATAISDNKISIAWTDASSNETGFEITRSLTSGGVYLPVATPTASPFIDSNLNASTQYFYKIRSINAGGGSVFVGPQSATTQAAPAAPAAPSNLQAQVLSVNSIILIWNDNSANETGFEVWRSVANTGNYRKIFTVNGGSGAQKSYTDTGLFANVVYYYKVRAAGTGLPSAYTAEVSATTLNTIPVLHNIEDYTMRYRTSFAVPVKATDTDGDPLTFTAFNLPYFATIQPVSHGNANIIFNPSVADQGAYTITVFVNDGFNGHDTTFFTLVVNDNTVPTLNSIANYTMNEGGSLTIPLVANDREGNASIIWGFTGLPSFATYVDSGNGRASVSFLPGYATSGFYTITASVDDGYGAWTSRTFTVSVTDTDPNEVVQVDMWYFAGTVPLWNRVDLSVAPPFNVSNLVNTKGQTTTIGLNVVSGTYSASTEGAQTNPDGLGVYPNNIIAGQLNWGFTPGNANDVLTVRVYGLNVSKKYNFIFFGSGTCPWCGLTASSATTYQIGSSTASVRFFNNSNETDTIYQVQPNASGEVFITMTGDPAAGVGGVLNAMVIDAQFDDSTLPLKPLNFRAEFVPNTGVRLTWKDQSYNEYSYKIYRATNPSGPYTQLNPGATNRDSSGYTDVTTAAFTQYYYYIVGANNLGNGVSSDTVAVLTGNNKPLITGVGNLFVKTGSSAQDDFSVSDDAGDIITVTIPNQPAYVTLTNLGGNNYRITAAPTVDNIGQVNLVVTASDDKGGVVTANMTITVADVNTRSVFVNLGNTGYVAPQPWNNFLSYGTMANAQINNLVDENNVTTTFGMQMLTAWPASTDQGHITGNNSGVYPDVVLQSGLMESASTVHQIRFSGLNPSLRYNLVFIGSYNDGRSAAAKYTIGTQHDTLDARNNWQQTANLNSLTPNASGQLTVDISKLPSAFSMFLNAVVIEEYQPSITLLNPINLYAEPRDRTSVFLSWSDRTNNENASNGYELQRATDAAFTQNLVTVNHRANKTADTITGLTANTKYWFRVRARTGVSTFSSFSNKVATITPQAIVYMNFNYEVAPAAFPWNNMNTSPLSLNTFPNLINQAGANTGISLVMLNTFNGENNAGMTTGNNSGVVPDNVLLSSYWLDKTQIARMKVSGLDQSKRYRFGYIGSSNWNTGGDYTGTFTINGRTVYLNSWQNTKKIVYIGDVVPDSNGEVILTFSTTQGAAYGFNSGILIESYTDTQGGTVLNAPNPANDGSNLIVRNTDQLPGADAQLNAKLFPNPFTDFVNIEFNNPSADNSIIVDVFDLNGKLVSRRSFGKLTQGYHTLRLSTAENRLTPGVYIVSLNVNGKPAFAGKLIRR